MVSAERSGSYAAGSFMGLLRRAIVDMNRERFNHIMNQPQPIVFPSMVNEPTHSRRWGKKKFTVPDYLDTKNRTLNGFRFSTHATTIYQLKLCLEVIILTLRSNAWATSDGAKREEPKTTLESRTKIGPTPPLIILEASSGQTDDRGGEEVRESALVRDEGGDDAEGAAGFGYAAGEGHDPELERQPWYTETRREERAFQVF
ncbi:hypothetical protein B0H16DRAFT_1471702 [Mycena metata]|uniref:Uncharacterized protein n=1 Tax=Mycena metata TaxID=1033252 RepID=A0AAD7HRG0_9AGAR|nr:hypothetical protein B0H16DRAFT_1471702 [Mycena metata]